MHSDPPIIVDEVDALKLELLETRLTALRAQVSLLQHQLDTLQTHTKQALKERDAFSAALAEKYGLSEGDAIDLTTRRVQRSAKATTGE